MKLPRLPRALRLDLPLLLSLAISESLVRAALIMRRYRADSVLGVAR